MPFYIKAFGVSIFWHPRGGGVGRSCGTTLLWIMKDMPMPPEVRQMIGKAGVMDKEPRSGVDFIEGS